MNINGAPLRLVVPFLFYQFEFGSWEQQRAFGGLFEARSRTRLGMKSLNRRRLTLLISRAASACPRVYGSLNLSGQGTVSKNADTCRRSWLNGLSPPTNR